MDPEIRVKLGGFDEAALQELSGDLCRALRLEAGIRADLAAGAAAPGSRGDAVSVGTIVLSLISSGAALALVNVLKAYFERRPSLEVEVQRDTDKVRIRAENLTAEQIGKTAEQIGALLKMPV